MRKVWDVIVDLVYEDAWQFVGPLVAVAVLYFLAQSVRGAWLGIVLFALVGLSLFMSLRREH
ncbi:MAG: hypothetical protein M0Z66_12825 [Thermaerobacter sp.]|nr:hypothetical protein [Thermaerobacter sp.]